MCSEDDSGSSSIPSYNYLPGGLKSGAIDITPERSRKTSPEQDQPAVKMADEETINALKKVRTAAMSRFTNLRKALLGMLNNPNVPVQKINASEKKLEDAFKMLNEAHGKYVAVKDREEEEPQDAAYMNEPIAERLEAETQWTEWHNEREKLDQELHRANREEAQRRSRAEALEDEERKRANERAYLTARVAAEMTRAKEALSS